MLAQDTCQRLRTAQHESDESGFAQFWLCVSGLLARLTSYSIQRPSSQMSKSIGRDNNLEAAMDRSVYQVLRHGRGRLSLALDGTRTYERIEPGFSDIKRVTHAPGGIGIMRKCWSPQYEGAKYRAMSSNAQTRSMYPASSSM